MKFFTVNQFFRQHLPCSFIQIGGVQRFAVCEFFHQNLKTDMIFLKKRVYLQKKPKEIPSGFVNKKAPLQGCFSYHGAV